VETKLVALTAFMAEGVDRRRGEVFVVRSAQLAAELVTMGRADFADERTRSRFTRRDRAQWSPADSSRPPMPQAKLSVDQWVAAGDRDSPRRRWLRDWKK
jgi:hypothetical protein